VGCDLRALNEWAASNVVALIILHDVPIYIVIATQDESLLVYALELQCIDQAVMSY
jgi:hypothetical protein